MIKKWKLFERKNVKIKKKRAHAFKGYSSSYNVEVLIFFNPELQLEDTKSPIKNNLKKLFFELRGFNLVTTPALLLKKIESEGEAKYDTFHLHSKAVTNYWKWQWW